MTYILCKMFLVSRIFLPHGDGGVLSNLKAIVPREKINSRRRAGFSSPLLFNIHHEITSLL